MTDVARRVILRSLRLVVEKRLSLPRGGLKLVLAANGHDVTGLDAIEALSTILVNAVDRAARGQRDAGYVCLLEGLQAAETSAMREALCGAALIRCYRELLDDYTLRYDICREAEEPREEPRLLAGLALMELGEDIPADPDPAADDRQTASYCMPASGAPD
jgi:hypothetical protein